jgi:SNF2 family DNA or RNA helicase
MLAKEKGGANLITAPLSVCEDWVDELTRQGLNPVPLYAMTGARAAEALSAKPQTAVLNYHKLDPLLHNLRAWGPKKLVFDESHLLKTPQADRSKAARMLARKADFVRVLTGTPSPNHLGDLWGQLVMVNPDSWNTSFTKFSQRFLIRHPIYTSNIIGYNNLDELQAMVTADADIIKRSDVFGPDTYQVVERWVDMPTKAWTAYHTLVKEWLYYLEQGGEVVADHTLKRLIRLQQLTSGYLKTEGGQVVDMHTAKIDSVLADLNEIVESGEKVVIFHKFSWEGAKYEEAVRREFPGLFVRRYYGGTPVAERSEIASMFRDRPGSAVIVAQTQAAGVGISFAEATHAMFVSQSFSFTDETQALDRIYKPGQVRVVTYYRCRNTTDEFIARTIGRKSDVHKALVNADIRSMAYGGK